MIHRPFLVTAASQPDTSIFETSVRTCLDAARQTVQLIYQTFINRPFFRTWWYNTTYAFNAASVILYSLVSRFQAESSQELLLDVEKALKVFQAMEGISVARRCAELTKEILDVVRVAYQNDLGLKPETDQQQQALEQVWYQPTRPATNQLDKNELLQASGPQQALPPTPFAPTNEQMQWDANTGQDDFFANIMDLNILDSFGANLMGFGGDFDMDLDGAEVDLGFNMDEMTSYGKT